MNKTGQRIALQALVITGVLWLAVAPMVRAGYYVEYTASVTPQQVFSGTGNGWSGQPFTVTLQQYDPASHGALLSVQFYLHGYFDSSEGRSSIALENLTPGYTASVSSIALSGTVYADWGVAGDDMNSVPAHNTASISLGAYDGTADLWGTDSQSWVVGDQATAQLTGSSGDMTLFTGTSTVPIHMHSSGYTFTYNPESLKVVASQAVAFLGADLTVRYTFVPEPMSLFLLGGGAALLLVRRSRRTTVTSA